MTFINSRLDPCVAYDFTGGPQWNTESVALDNGFESRNGKWLYPKGRYQAQYMNLQKGRKQLIIAAFNGARGKLHNFRFKDWNDFEAVSEGGAWEPILLPSVGTSTPAQLLKRYFLGAQGTDRPIQAPVAGTVVVYRDGSPVAVTVDEMTGLVTPDANWVAGDYTWTGEHDVWVHFESDYNAFTIGSRDSATSDIVLVEEYVP